MRAAITGWGTAVPEQRLTNADLETARRHVRRVDRRAHRHPGTAHRRRGRDHRQPGDRGRRGGDQARGHHARGRRPPDRRNRDPRAAHPPHGRVRRRRARASVRVVRPRRRVRRIRLRARDRRGAAHERRPRPRARDRRRDAVAFIDPHDRGTCILFGDGAGAMRARPVTRRRPGLLSWDLGCDGSATGLARDPRRREPPPAERGDGRRRSPLREDAGTRGVPPRGAGRRRTRAGITLAKAGVTADRGRLVRPPPGEPPHHRSRVDPARHPDGAHRRQHRALRQHRRRRRSRSRSPRPPTTAGSRTATSCSSPASAPA